MLVPLKLIEIMCEKKPKAWRSSAEAPNPPAQPPVPAERQGPQGRGPQCLGILLATY